MGFGAGYGEGGGDNCIFEYDLGREELMKCFT